MAGMNSAPHQGRSMNVIKYLNLLHRIAFPLFERVSCLRASAALSLEANEKELWDLEAPIPANNRMFRITTLKNTSLLKLTMLYNPGPAGLS